MTARNHHSCLIHIRTADPIGDTVMPHFDPSASEPMYPAYDDAWDPDFLDPYPYATYGGPSRPDSPDPYVPSLGYGAPRGTTDFDDPAFYGFEPRLAPDPAYAPDVIPTRERTVKDYRPTGAYKHFYRISGVVRSVKVLVMILAFVLLFFKGTVGAWLPALCFVLAGSLFLADMATPFIYNAFFAEEDKDGNLIETPITGWHYFVGLFGGFGAILFGLLGFGIIGG